MKENVPYFICKRLRMQQWLARRGFAPTQIVKDDRNPDFVNWIYVWDVEFEKARCEYLDESIKQRKERESNEAV